MQEEKNPQSGAGSESAENRERQEEATSSATLSDVEETEKSTVADDESSRSSTPSPDGAFDSDEGERSPKDNPGPM
jgi:hypothetical protein